eukprot:TRINITY_DN14057_c0_g1_i1.p1 TRINITY_DN14057_c0_g1~~TRINITY_DN14057_c0_g1_i1.p1  ORF type:complete len:257 (+),score=49.22 TRINITY_DN14057_c0_g1_i1:95-865(+)
MSFDRDANLPPSDNLFMADLPEGITEDMLRQVFSSYGTVRDCKVIGSNTPGTSAALVRFASVQEGEWIVANLNGRIPEGLMAPVVVRFSSSKGGKGKGKVAARPAPYHATATVVPPRIPAMPVSRGPVLETRGGVAMAGGKGKGKCKDGSCIRSCTQSLAEQTLPGGAKCPNDGNTVFVAGLPRDTTNLEMYHMFSPFGAIAYKGCTASLDKMTGDCIGIGFVNYLDHDAALAAITALNGLQPQGCIKPLEVKLKT